MSTGTVKDAFNAFYGQYLKTHAPTPRQRKAAESVMACRTAAMGSHAYVCDECGYTEVSHNSCRDRHCPNCQATSAVAWVNSRMHDVLPAPYFHVVLTLPSELHMLVYQNQKQLYGLMHRACAEAVMKLARDPKYLGAEPGFFSVLHTWGDNLHYHPHIHTVIVAGGLTKDNRWRKGNGKFFLPVKVLAKMFRGIFMSRLKKMYEDRSLYSEGLCGAEKDDRFYGIVDACFKKDWYVHIKQPFSGPAAVLKYLGRYTHRVAISNERIVSVGDGRVVFRPKHKDKGGERKPIALDGTEFVGRFLMHVLPKGFVKIRHYGILANRNRKTKLALCKTLTRNDAAYPPADNTDGAPVSKVDMLIRVIGRDFTVCPCCGLGRMRSCGYVGPVSVRSP
jgi:hypothetical protein